MPLFGHEKYHVLANSHARGNFSWPSNSPFSLKVLSVFFIVGVNEAGCASGNKVYFARLISARKQGLGVNPRVRNSGYMPRRLPRPTLEKASGVYSKL
jgi:hypothetical protein